MPFQPLSTSHAYLAIGQTYSHQHVKEAINSMGITSDDRILDLGCGDGRTAMQYLANGARQLVCIDHNPYRVAEATSILSRVAAPGTEVTVKQGDVTNTDFMRQFRHKPGSPGPTKIFCLSTLHVILRERGQAGADKYLRAWAKLLAPGGQIICSLSDPAIYMAYLVQLHFNAGDRDLDDYTIKCIYDISTQRGRDANAAFAREQAEKAGLAIARSQRFPLYQSQAGLVTPKRAELEEEATVEWRRAKPNTQPTADWLELWVQEWCRSKSQYLLFPPGHPLYSKHPDYIAHETEGMLLVLSKDSNAQ